MLHLWVMAPLISLERLKVHRLHGGYVKIQKVGYRIGILWKNPTYESIRIVPKGFGTWKPGRGSFYTLGSNQTSIIWPDQW